MDLLYAFVLFCCLEIVNRTSTLIVIVALLTFVGSLF